MIRFAAALTAVTLIAFPARAEIQTAIFAGGCFWCVESDMDRVPGVIGTTSGYTGGHLKSPSYRDVVTETTGHREAVEVRFDADKVSYEKLVASFLRSIDPLDEGGQFCDRGESYTTAIFTLDDKQKAAAEKAIADAAAILKQPIATKVIPASTFYMAESYHQNYYRTNALKYKYYRNGCGRDQRIGEVWGAAAHQGLAAAH